MIVYFTDSLTTSKPCLVLFACVVCSLVCMWCCMPYTVHAGAINNASLVVALHAEHLHVQCLKSSNSAIWLKFHPQIWLHSCGSSKTPAYTNDCLCQVLCSEDTFWQYVKCYITDRQWWKIATLSYVHTEGPFVYLSNQSVNSPCLQTDCGVTCVNGADVTSPDFQPLSAMSIGLSLQPCW